MTSRPNPLPPDRMGDRERLEEVHAILAAGIVRMRAGAAGLSAEQGDFPLHNPPDPSGHAAPRKRRTA